MKVIVAVRFSGGILKVYFNPTLCLRNASTLCISHPKIFFFYLNVKVVFTATETIKPWLKYCNLDVKNVL